MKRFFSALAGLVCAAAFADGETFYGKPLENLPVSDRMVISAKPAAKIKAFAVMPATVSPELQELQARFGMDYVLFQTNSFEKFSPWSNGARNVESGVSKEDYEKIAAEKTALLKECNLILLGKISLSVLPESLRKAILARVEEGVPLLYIAFEGSGIPKKELGIKEEFTPRTPKTGPLANLRAWRGKLGKGSTVALDYGKFPFGTNAKWYAVEPLAPFESDDPLYYDLCHMLLAECLLDLAAPDRERIGAETLENGEIRDRFGAKEREFSKLDSIPKDLSGGEKLLLSRKFNGNGELVDFSVKAFSVTPETGIAEFGLEKESYKPGETARGKIVFSKPFTGELSVVLKSTEGREIVRRSFQSSDAREETFEFTVPDPYSQYGELSAVLSRDGRKLDEKRSDVYFNTPKNPADFRFMVWAHYTANSRIAKFFFDALDKSGVDIMMDSEIVWMKDDFKPGMIRRTKKANLDFAAYAAALRGREDPSQCPLSNWDQWEKEKRPVDESLAAQAKTAAGPGCSFYNLGDENCLGVNTELCFCEKCQAAFPEYLKRVYGTLDKLNAEYGSKYNSWESIRGITLEDACDKDRLPQWVDYRLFMEERFTNLHRWAAAQVREFDPEAVCGIEGIAAPYSSYSGFRLYDLLPNFDFFAPYPSNREVHAMKYLRPGAFKAAWFGSYQGTMNEPNMRSTPWNHLFAGLNATAWWMAGGIYSHNGFSNLSVFTPDLRILTPYRQATEEIRRIRETGIGALLVRAEKQKTEIAMHYSNNSLHASTLNPDKSSWRNSLDDFGSAVNALGLEFEFLSPKEIETGSLSRFKVLILPYSQALSPKEAEEIRGFVRKGGLLLADFNPGIMDEHGKTLAESPLAEVFGKFERMHLNRFGNGRAVYFGDYLSGFPARMQKGESQGILKGLARLLKEYAGVKPFAEVSSESSAVEAYTLFEKDGEKYLCFSGPSKLRKVGGGGAEAQSENLGGGSSSTGRAVRLPEKYHVYDPLDNHRFLGFTDSFRIELEPYVGRVIVLRKDAPEKPAVVIENPVLKAGEALKIRVRNPAAVMLWRIEGLPFYRGRFSGGEFQVFTACGDKPGKYVFEIKSAVTGETASAEFEIQ